MISKLDVLSIKASGYLRKSRFVHQFIPKGYNFTENLCRRYGQSSALDCNGSILKASKHNDYK